MSDQPITHELALDDLRHILWAIQKARSTMAENGWESDADKWVLADLQPWVWGEKSLLHPLSDLITRCTNAGRVPAMDYYNILIICHKLAPSLAAWVDMEEAIAGHSRALPEPDLGAIMKGLGSTLP